MISNGMGGFSGAQGSAEMDGQEIREAVKECEKGLFFFLGGGVSNSGQQGGIRWRGWVS